MQRFNFNAGKRILPDSTWLNPDANLFSAAQRSISRLLMNRYKSYKNLPSLAGVCTMEEAMKPGLSVDQCVRRLKRSHYAFKRLHHIFPARITAEPIYELKMGFSLHAHL